MSLVKIITLTNNFEKAKEIGDKFFGKGSVDLAQNDSTDKLYTWNYIQGSQDLKCYLYGALEDQPYRYSNKNCTLNIPFDDAIGAIVLLDFADNMAFKFLIDNVEKIWNDLNTFLPIAVLGFWDMARFEKSTDNHVYVPSPIYGGSMEHICELVCNDLSKKATDKDFEVYFKPLDRTNPSLDGIFIEYLISFINDN